MRIFFAVAPGHGLMLPVVPLMWAARAWGHEILVATTSEMVDVGARAGLPVVDVFPDRDIWSDLIGVVVGTRDVGDLPEHYQLVRGDGNPFGLFTLTMTEGTVAACRDFDADLVVHTSDHVAGQLTAAALGVPSVEVGNRVSWSMRDEWSRTDHNIGSSDRVTTHLRATLDIGDAEPTVLARVDPRPPSMGGLREAEPDPRDGVPWWPMRFVPFNGGAVVPPWALHTPRRPRVCVTLGTVVPSMDGTTTLAAVVEALEPLDVDVVLAAGATDLSDLGTLPAHVRPVGYLALSVILPTCALAVHHGGSGSTAAALHYGVPQLVLPSFADNPIAARRVTDRGVGLSLDPATLDVATVRESVRRLLCEPSFARAAGEVRAEMAGQPSPAAVLDDITRAISTPRPHPGGAGDR